MPKKGSGRAVGATALNERQRAMVAEFFRDPFRSLAQIARAAGVGGNYPAQAWTERLRDVVRAELRIIAERYAGRTGALEVIDAEVVRVRENLLDQARALADEEGDEPLDRDGVIRMYRADLRLMGVLMNVVNRDPEFLAKLAATRTTILDRIAKATGADKPAKEDEVLMVFAGLRRDQTEEEWAKANGFVYEPPPPDPGPES